MVAKSISHLRGPGMIRFPCRCQRTMAPMVCKCRISSIQSIKKEVSGDLFFYSPCQWIAECHGRQAALEHLAAEFHSLKIGEEQPESAGKAH